MRTTRRVASAGLLLATLTIGIGACAGPPSYDPSPKKWEDNGGEQRAVAQPPDDGNNGDSGDGDSSDSGDSGNGSGGDSVQVELCSVLDVATVQQAFDAPEEPTTSSTEQTAGLPDLTVMGGCAYEWTDGDTAGSLSATAAVADTSDDAATFLEGQASSAGLSGETVEGFGDASILDTSGSVQSDAAVAIGVTDVEGTKTVVVLVGPLDADASAYAEVGSSVMDAVAQS